MTIAVEEHPLSVVESRPRFEGSNICSWIGFKHVMYLVEEAVLDHFRQSGLPAGRLYEEHGLGVEIVDSDARILHALHIDDAVRSEVRPATTDQAGELVFDVTSYVDRGEAVKAVTAKVTALLRRDDDAGELPTELRPHTVAAIERAPAGRHGAAPGPPAADTANAVAWVSRIPYFYCHYSRRLQHSGYLRLMEEVVDRFLLERGISIRTMLEDRQWIPVVPHARVQILREALMEEEVRTVLTVEEIFKDLTWTARMDCYVPRGGALLHTATGKITHGYAVILDRRNWKLVNLDARTMDALRGRPA